MTPREKSTAGGLESAVFVFALAMCAEVFLRWIPGLGALPVDTVAMVRLSLFVAASAGMGFWMQRRYALRIPVAALAFAFGVLASFLIRSLRDNLEGSIQTEDLNFTLGLAIVNWVVLLVGAAIGRWRNSAAR